MKRLSEFLQGILYFLDDDIRFQDAKTALYTSYIECLVYSPINTLKLKHIQYQWTTYFPDEEIKVSLNDRQRVLWIFHQRADRIRTEDMYMKEDNGTVHCYRTVVRVMKRISPLNLERYKKLQSFIREEPWGKPVWRSFG